MLPGREETVGGTAKDNGLFVEAVVYRYHAWIPRRDLPTRFGDFGVVHTHHTRWSRSSVWKQVFERLAPNIPAHTIIGDKAFDADERVIQPRQQAGKTIVIPPKFNRTTTREYDKDLSRTQHLIENCFARLKQFRAIATRYDKRAANFLGAIYLTAALTRLN